MQLPVAGGNFWGKITMSKNKLCSIFVVNAIKNFLRYDKRDGSTQLYSDIMLNRIISLIVCVCLFFIIVFILSAVFPLPNTW